jgi:hypothetical protein
MSFPGKAGAIQLRIESIKAKDPPWDAVLMGSVASTVNAKLESIFHKSR